MPITVGDISDVIAVYPSPIHRHLLDEFVFAIDDEYLKAVQK